MSRIPEGEYDDEDSQRRYALQCANLKRQINGKRGQAFLRELLGALEALPEKALIEGHVSAAGMVCTFGALALKRRTDAGEQREAVLADLESVVVHLRDEDGDEPEDYEPMWEWAERELAAPSHLAWHIVELTDDDGRMCTGHDEMFRPIIVEATPAMRYERMVRQIQRMLGEEVETPPA